MSTRQPSPDLVVAVPTRNNRETISRTLRSVQGLARRVLVVDSGSTDGTIETCRSAGAEVVERAWPGMTAQRQFMLDACREHRWVLLLDSDESLEPSLRDSLCDALVADDPAFAGWYVNRKLYFLGGWLEHAFQPEWRLRLVRGGRARMEGLDRAKPGSTALLHDVVSVEGRTGRLAGDLRHDSWRDVGDMFRRSIAYGNEAAAQGAHGGRLSNVLVSPMAAFSKQFVIKRGFLDGPRGLIASGGAAASTLMKHLFIAQRRVGRNGRKA